MIKDFSILSIDCDSSNAVHVRSKRDWLLFNKDSYNRNTFFQKCDMKTYEIKNKTKSVNSKSKTTFCSDTKAITFEPSNLS